MENIRPGWRSRLTSDIAVIGYIASIKLILQLAAIQGYGYFRDEFYYIACSEHLDFGYVDQPPLSIFLLRIIRFFFGDSVFAIRLLPALAGFFFVFITGLIARELGGKKFAMSLASIAALAPIGNFFIHTYYSMNFLDHIFWLLCIYIIIKIIKTGNPKFWLLFGLVAGLGLQNKISILFLGCGVAIGLILTRERKYFKSPYLWVGLGIALLIFLPYILWNVSHDWAHIEFMENAKEYKMSSVNPLEFFLGQLIFNGFSFPVWFAGLWFLFFSRKGSNYRMFGWIFLSVYLIFMIQSGKDYYLSGLYPVLFAGGAVQIEQFSEKRSLKTWFRPMLISLILIVSLFLAPFALPILPVDTYIKYADAIGLKGVQGENLRLGSLPQHFADMHGWEEIVGQVAAVYNSLPPDDRAICAILAPNYGVAGAIDLLGKEHGLPDVICGHNSYYLWGPDSYSGRLLIVIGRRYEDLSEYYKSVNLAAFTKCSYCMPYENNRPIFICREPKVPLIKIWHLLKIYI